MSVEKSTTISAFELITSYELIYVVDFTGELRTIGILDHVKLAHQHLEQGFLWMPGSVCFSTVTEEELISVEVLISDEIILRKDAYRSIQVPFTVGQLGAVMIKSIFPEDMSPVSVPPGCYALIYEIGHKPYDPEYYRSLGEGLREGYGEVLWERPMWCRFTFVPQQTVKAAILYQAPLLEHGDSASREISPAYSVFLGAGPGQYTIAGEAVL